MSAILYILLILCPPWCPCGCQPPQQYQQPPQFQFNYRTTPQFQSQPRRDVSVSEYITPSPYPLYPEPYNRPFPSANAPRPASSSGN